MTQRSNLNVGDGFEWRLVNAVKESQSPFNNTGGATGYLTTDPLTGYPTELVKGTMFTCNVRPDPSGNDSTYVIKWRGQAIVFVTSFGALTGSARTRNGISWVSASAGASVLHGRMTFQCGYALNGSTNGNHSSAVTVKGDGRTGATNQLTNFIICRLDEEDYLDDQMAAGVPDWRVFRPGFISLLQDYNPRCLRFMDDMQTNVSIRSRWQDQASLDAMALHCRPYINLVSSSSTLGLITRTGTDVYICDAYAGMPGSYVHGEIVQGHVDISNSTTTPTLDVGGRGNKSILDGTSPGPINPVIGGTNAQTALLAGVQSAGNGSYTFIYDQYFTAGGGGGSGAWIFTPNGANFGRPIEHLVALCNEANIPGWFCIPAYATDDYVTQFANYLATNYTPDEVDIEFANEIWNTALGFSMSLRVSRWGLQTFTSPQITTSSNAALHTWYGLRFRQIAQIMRPILGSKLKMIFAMQGSHGDNTVDLPGQDQALRLQNVNYAETSGSNAAYHFADYHSYAWYHRPVSIIGDANNVGWSAVTQAATLKGYVDSWTADNSRTDGFVWMRDEWLVDSAITSRLVAGGRVDKFNAQAISFGNVQVAMYEMNQQVDAPNTSFCSTNAPWNDASYGGQSGKINKFLLAFLASTYFEDVVTSILTQFYGYSQSLSASIYAIAIGNPWLTFSRLLPMTGTLGGDTTQAPFGNWQAHVAWNNGGDTGEPPPTEAAPAPDRTVKVKGHNRTVTASGEATRSRKVAASSRIVKARE